MMSDQDAADWDRGKEHSRELRELLDEFMAGNLDDHRSGERERIATERGRTDSL
jgi:hypothetical protein|tara:strand:+ start:246 stop:407 length:162 start_codon:yes stop_codon:yes gene_type:complete